MTGRPTNYEPRYCDQVVEAAQAGYSLTGFAGMISVDRDAITEWGHRHVNAFTVRSVRSFFATMRGAPINLSESPRLVFRDNDGTPSARAVPSMRRHPDP